MLAGLLLFALITAHSQTITIGGDIYGGGREGAVGTAKAVDSKADKNSVALNTGALTAGTYTTEIVVKSGSVRTVFGGGENGRTFGNTSVTIQGTTSSTQVGSSFWDGSIYGGVFGAGDGESAFVFGNSNVFINGGTIVQNVYGGGNRADLIGTTSVLLRGGKINESVFGGARLANIFGYSFVNIDGAHAANDLVISAVYGGNDIAGNISSTGSWSWLSTLTLPSELSLANQELTKFKSFNAFVYSTPESNNKHIFVGQLYGGGNGDYHYTENQEDATKLDMSDLWDSKTFNETTQEYETTPHLFTVSKTPEVGKVYLELKGGTYGYVYGGGNNATVTQNVDICLNNQTPAANIHTIKVTDLEAMGLNYDESDNSYTITGTGSDRTLKSKYQFDRVFGGNNKATMNLQPEWHITKATINNLYSGGNAGSMTWYRGLLLTLTSSDLEVNNVYGGCRRADVIPNLPAGQVVAEMTGSAGGYSYKFDDDYSARIFISAGKINNVYGGNDISGKVVGGNAIDIRSSILGDVYGGGNGSYAYTDNAQLSNHHLYQDFYYTIPNGKTSAQALNDFRPNAEQAWIHVAGASEQNPTVIGGSLYLGGNSATLDIDENDANAANKSATLKIGSNVIAHKVFLGSNGENMIDPDMLAMYNEGQVDGKDFSQIAMNQANFTEYIKGVSVGIKPKVLFDDNYVANSTKIGSFYFGGNLGSVTASGTFNVNFAKPVVIYERLVAGCNNANYVNSTYGIDYTGGVTTAPASGQPKINMTLDGITLMPGKLENNDVVWNTVSNRLVGGQIFGGCYESGIIQGDVVINLTSAAYDDAKTFMIVDTSGDTPVVTTPNSGVTRDVQLNDVFSTALSIFGGGYGPSASIEGNTTINVSSSGRILKVFGGGLEGPVNGNTTINLTGGTVGKIYGGGFEGRINGSTAVYLDGGTVYNAFGGACNADIRDYAQVFVGQKETGFTTVQNNVYGGNDFGGSILGLGDFSTEAYVTSTEKSKAYNPGDKPTPDVLTASTYVEYVQGTITNNIFGGSCGDYDYSSESPYYSHIPEAKRTDPLPKLESAFVHFKGNNEDRNTVKQVFAAGEGKVGIDASANIQDKMQQRSYLLLNSTADSTFKKTDIFGAGANCGVGMQVAQSVRTGLDAYSAVVDLMAGWVNDAYGASYNEGFTRRTIVNVPEGSTARMADLFGGGYGRRLTSPCDVYESHIKWNSSNAMCGYIYGANNNARRTLYTFIDINAEAWSDKSQGYMTTVYGAGCGKDTWAEYTEVNLNNGALVYEVYGGGYGGKVVNLASLNAWETETRNDDIDDNTLYTTIGSDYTDLGLEDPLVWANQLEVKTNTNVFIHKGAEVGLRSDRRSEGIYPVTILGGYAYGGGYGDKKGGGADITMGSVYGTTYVGLHGGIVWKDMYAGCTYGGVYDKYNVGFTATANAYVQGGAVRNVYGAGWKGRVGYTELPVTVNNPTNASVDAILAHDIPGVSNVVIGIPEDRKAGYGNEWGFYMGVPTVERNAYSSGEDGGCVIGTANLTIYNGYIGYRYYDVAHQYDVVNPYETFTATDNPETEIDERYMEKVYDETWTFDKNHPNVADGIDRLTDSGNAFGGGYTDNATADNTIVTVWGGHIRNSVYGGGEVAAIGRGEANEAVGSAIRTLKGIYKSGSTQVNIYSGHIDRNVFGGGKGFNNNGTKGNLLTDGYVFGTTEVNIYGGEIGTDLTVLEGDGNVFGGGNIGYVFNSRNSAKFTGDEEHPEDTVGIGYYYKIKADGTFDKDHGERQLSEDCRVVVTPYSKVLGNTAITLVNAEGQSQTFHQFDFVPTEYLNKLRKTDSRWYKYNEDEKKYTGILDQTGIIIHNAIFAGGNVSSGNELYANTKTVFGNATATVNDLYYLDLITVGTEHIGGLYGDGNLTRVDGYRELNITNYGTDYYGMNTTRVTLDDYHKMNDRERAYFQLKYESTKAFNWSEHSYSTGTILTKEEIKEKLSGAYDEENNNHVVVNADGTPDPEYWEEYGFVSIYAGRLINTIQRADFVGVFGSRMVMQGARDRVPETVDFTDYTINRVGEVSLNRIKNPNNDKDTIKVVNSEGDTIPQIRILKNGNYFGIYNIVNHLAALTSDIDLEERRVTGKEDDLYQPKKENNGSDTTFIGWKNANKLNRRRNDGKADNKVALASGVYLELTTEKSTADNKDWGLITGVLELDLINVMPGLGGGYVYAKNEHGVRDTTGLKHITLSKYNKNAVSNKKYRYDNPGTDDDFQTSGNLVSSKTIIDDCYPTSDSYLGADAAKGHYWYIKGEIYLYDLYLSAYTGAAEAYSKTVSIPLTITAGSHGVIKLQDVKPNKYIYYGSDGVTPLTSEQKIVINNVTYQLNDSISYWDWLQLADADKSKFVDTTYVSIAECTVGTGTSAKTYAKGTVLSSADYKTLYNGLGTEKTVHHVAKDTNVPVEEVFHLSNDMSHSKGYALTLDMNNPVVWDKYYTSATGLTKTNTQTNGYLNAPTYKALNSNIYGQREYGYGDIIVESVYNTYQELKRDHSNLIPQNEAVFEEAYVMNQDWSKEFDGVIRYFNKGLVMSKTDWSLNGIGNKADVAYFCTDTWKLEHENKLDEYVFYGTCITEAEIRALAATYELTEAQITEALNTHFAKAYYCSTAGKYGGNYYQANSNYLTKVAWAAMNPEDRVNFKFNYDALDVLIDPEFAGIPSRYDREAGAQPTGQEVYSVEQPIDYTAKYTPEDPITYIDRNNQESDPIVHNQTLNREEYESLPNEQYHYSPIQVDGPGNVYVVKTSFTHGNELYSIGNVVSQTTYNSMPGNHGYFDILNFTAAGKYYYCRDSYALGEHGSVSGYSSDVTDVLNRFSAHNNVGSIVEPGYVITEANYLELPNIQKYFSVHGKTPVGVSTLYVSGQSNILDLSKGRIYTVTLVYDYEESDENGQNINQISEKHVINIHVNFQGGTPTIAQISNPPTVLPGSTIGISQPRVTPGAYEVIGGGWEIFPDQKSADNHTNGANFDNGKTQLYWYNDDYYLAYYAKTYLGKTYSNAVPIKVGNYHDLARVMTDTVHHMYVDHPNVKRKSKIYITNDKFDDPDPQKATKNELDMFKDFFDLSLEELRYDENNNPIKIASGTLKDHIPMNAHVQGGKNLDFILKSDIAPKAYTNWTSIGYEPKQVTVTENGQEVTKTVTQCFKGTLHGDGHTISGLNNSLFNYLCDDSIYNLGVTGTFSGSGIAEIGGTAFNCWIMTTTDADLSGKNAVMGTGIINNCYYPDINGYQASAAIAKPLTAFHNGEVAYDLNGFYLAKRYAIENDANDNKFYYKITDNNNNLLSTLPDGFIQGTDYVSQRYADGDFIYAKGVTPDQSNERMFSVEPAEGDDPDPKYKHYFPIYPDDYIFFGQMLTYGYSSVTGESYQQYPSSINRADRNSVGTQHYASQWIVREEQNSTSSIKSNRVYRAPAYFGNSTMSVVHFNANAMLPSQTSGNNPISIYPGLTALDLTGYNDDTWNNGWTQDGKFFMTKILDYNSLTGFRSDGQTRNLLVYTPHGTNTTNTILTTYLADRNYTMSTDGYNSVQVLDNELASRVKGHLIHDAFADNDNNYYAAGNQYLVDGQSFNAPIEYIFGQNTHMWYQRTPSRFVESMDAGWDVISLPFTAEYVTTQQKGELTHFYSGSTTGHEYWLREYNNVTSQTDDQNITTSKAMFSAPAAINLENNQNYLGKSVGNTFLWDYYYSKNQRKDDNSDLYQQFYNNDRDYDDYPFYTAGTPYLIGLPGNRFYEFDLSGQFEAQHTAGQPAKLAPQILTFISPDAGTTIRVTDTEYASAVSANTNSGYIFTPTYQTKTVDEAYLISNDGSKFVRTTDAVTTPFRAYMTKTAQLAQQRAGTRASAGADVLFIGYTGDSDQLIETPADRGLTIIGQSMQISIESTLDVPATVTITTTAGRLLKQFIIQPGTKVTVPVNSRGIYIVNHHKIAVTK